MRNLTLSSMLFLGTVACSGIEDKVEEPLDTPKVPEVFTPLKEYCVLATDDATVQDPVEFADLYFDGQRFSDCPYHNYSKSTRVLTDTSTVGMIPESVFENGYSSEFMTQVDTLCHHNGNTYTGRVQFIFTGPEFDKQKQEPYRYLRSGTDSFNGLEWTYVHS